MESEQHWFKTCRRPLLDLDASVTPADIAYTSRVQLAQVVVRSSEGRPAALVDLLSGKWDNERFLVLEPGQSLAATAMNGCPARAETAVNHL
jgi:hypothetical protein